MGGYKGEHRHTGVYSSFLVGLLDDTSGPPKVVSFAKVGTGFTAEQLRRITDQVKWLVPGRKGQPRPGPPSCYSVTGFEPEEGFAWAASPEEFMPVLLTVKGEARASPSVVYRSGFTLRFPRCTKVRLDAGDIKDWMQCEKLQAVLTRIQQWKSDAAAGGAVGNTKRAEAAARAARTKDHSRFVDDKLNRHQLGGIVLGGASSLLGQYHVHVLYSTKRLSAADDLALEVAGRPFGPRDDLYVLAKLHGGRPCAGVGGKCNLVVCPDVMPTPGVMVPGRADPGKEEVYLAEHFDVVTEAWLRQSVASRTPILPFRPEHYRSLTLATRERMHERGQWDQFAVPYTLEPTTVGREEKREEGDKGMRKGCLSTSFRP